MQTTTVTLTPQPWRWSRPRVLVEHPDETVGLEIAGALRLAGYAVAICGGPQQPGQCPLADSDGCPAAQDADLVVSCLGYESEAAREVLRALRVRCPRVPLVVELPLEPAGVREVAEGCHAIAAPATPDRVVAAVQEVLRPNREGRGDGA